MQDPYLLQHPLLILGLQVAELPELPSSLSQHIQPLLWPSLELTHSQTLVTSEDRQLLLGILHKGNDFLHAA